MLQRNKLNIEGAKQSNLLRLIERELGCSAEKRGHNYFVSCPFHLDRDPSLAIYTRNWRCYGCNEHGDAIAFIQKLHNRSFVEAVQYLSENVESQQVVTVSHSKPVQVQKYLDINLINYWHQNLRTKPERLAYLHGRLLTDDTIDLDQFGWNSDGYYVIPVWENYPGKSRVLSVRMRAGNGQQPRYKGIKDFNQPALYSKWAIRGDVVYLFFGEFDARLAIQDGLSAVSMTNGKETFLPEWLKYFESVRRIIIVPDYDSENKLVAKGVKTEHETAVGIAGMFGSRARIFKWPSGAGKDYNAARMDGMAVCEFQKMTGYLI